MTKKEQINSLLTRGVEEIIHKHHLEKQLLSGKKLRVKLGIDPTSPNIHIGRAVSLWKLRAFQNLGHTAIFIVGDFTGRIGDTSDKDSERPMLTETQVKENLKTYFEQAFKILDKSKTETYYNSKWLKELGFIEIARMASLFSLHEFESRENIAKRLKAGKRITFHEVTYPLMQGYDSVAVKADVELGGTDQRFNLLAGRTIQELYKQEPQDILMTTLLEGPDGRKMSSSWGNTINLTDSAQDMFGKAMSIPDVFIEKYFLLTTSVSDNEIKQIFKEHSNPRDQKLKLARALVAQYYDEKTASVSEEQFLAQFSRKELPDEIETRTVKPGTYKLSELIATLGLTASKSEAQRLIKQNGVKLNQKVTAEQELTIEKKNDLLLQVGKRKFVRIK